MKLSRRSLVIFCLGWLTSLILAGLVIGHYYIEYQREKQLSLEYANMYNNFMQNYTDLLNDHLALIQQYEFEKGNLTELLEKYGKCVMQVNICIDYKEWNGTVVWYNNTIVPLGCDLLQATKMIAVVNYTYWPAYQAFFVDAINGVWKSSTCFWMWYRWKVDKEMWEYGNVGADRCSLTNNETVMWRYEIPGYS